MGVSLLVPFWTGRSLRGFAQLCWLCVPKWLVVNQVYGGKGSGGGAVKCAYKR